MLKKMQIDIHVIILIKTWTIVLIYKYVLKNEKHTVANNKGKLILAIRKK